MTVGWKFPCRKQKNIAEQIRRSNKLLVATSRYCIYTGEFRAKVFISPPPLCVKTPKSTKQIAMHAALTTTGRWRTSPDRQKPSRLVGESEAR